jgi:hypothetical protein
MTATATVHTQASMSVRPIALALKKWETMRTPNGQLGLRPEKGTWHAQIVRGASRTDSTVVPMVACPRCAHLLILTPTPGAARAVSRMLGKAIPVAHSIDSYGKVSPDLLCMHGGCDFHRTIYLDQWNRQKPLYAIAYTKDGGDELLIDYCHATNQREARAHLGAGNFNVIAVGPAVGFWQNEKTGKLSTEIR